jgi:hypothetical protein
MSAESVQVNFAYYMNAIVLVSKLRESIEQRKWTRAYDLAAYFPEGALPRVSHGDFSAGHINRKAA